VAEASATAGALPASPGDVRIGRIIKRSFQVFGSNLPKFFLLMLLVRVAEFLLAWLVTGDPFLSGDATALRVGAVSVMAWALLGFVGVLAHAIGQAVILYGSFQGMSGRPVSLGESLMKGLRRLLPIIVLTVCLYVMLTIGFVLLIFPGLMLMTAMSAALPVCVVEKLGPFKSMRRSARLTKGYRWRLLGLFLIVFVAGAIIGSIPRFVIGAIAGPTLVTIVAYVISAFVGVYYGVAAAVVYHDLRVAKEGIDLARIVAVFD
jgi:hypothetical protein